MKTVQSSAVSRVHTKLLDADSSRSGNVPCACVADTNTQGVVVTSVNKTTVVINVRKKILKKR